MAVGWTLRGMAGDARLFCIDAPVNGGKPLLIHEHQ